MSSGDFLVQNGIISEYNNVPVFFDEPKFYTLVGDIADPTNPSVALFTDEPQLGKVGGTALSFERAQTKFVGEAIERYALVPTIPYDLHGSYTAICQSRSFEILDPDEIICDRESTASKRGYSFAWYRASHMATKGEVLVPSHLVDVPAVLEDGDRFLRDPITTGAASHTNETACQLAAIYEVWERHLLLTKWLRGEKPYLVTLPNKLPGYLQKLIDHILRYRLTIRYFSLGAPEGFHAYICYIVDPTATVPFTIGAAFHHDPETALIKAAEEAVQIRPWLRIISLSAPTRPLTLKTVRDRAAWTLTKESKAAVDQWLNANEEMNCPQLEASGQREPTNEELLSDIVGKTLARGGTPIHLSLVPRLPSGVRDRYFACRVLIPEFQPLYFDEAERPLRVKLSKEEVLCHVPHPFV